MTNALRFLILIYIFLPTHAKGGLHDAISHPEVQNYIGETVFHYDLGVAMIFHNEGPYLKEWIEYYRHLGVQRFYLYDHFSSDNSLDVLEPYIRDQTVVLKRWNLPGDNLSSWNAAQCLAYMDALECARNDRVKWLAIIDSDEFMVPRSTDSLVECLSQYEDDTIGGIRVYWVMFGTSYVKEVPKDKLLIETLLLNEGYVEGASKPIVRPRRCNPGIMGGPHHQCFKEGYIDHPVSTDEIQCNHYWTRDEQYLNNMKIPRRIAWGTPPEVCLTWNQQFNKDTAASEPILRFVPALRQKMGLQQ